MAKSFISYKGKGFWLNDAWSEMIAQILIEQLNSNELNPVWTPLFHRQLESIAKGFFPGFVNFGFDDYLITNDDVNYLLDLIESSIKKLNKVDLLSHDTFIELFKGNPQFDRRWDISIESYRIINIFTLLKNIILGKQGYLSTDKVDYDNWSMK